MDRERKGGDLSRMLDLIRRRELLTHNRSEDQLWVEVGTEVEGAPVRIEILLPGNRWSTPRELTTTPPVGLRYESRMTAWNLDYMVEAFDAIYGRHPSILGPWVTVVRRDDQRTYDGLNAWDMNRVASMFRTQRGLKPMRGKETPEDEAAAMNESEDVVSVKIHTELQGPFRSRTKDTVLEFHRVEDRFSEVVRYGASSPSSEFMTRVLQNVLWGRPPRSESVAGLRAQVEDLVALLVPGRGGTGFLGGAAAS